MYKALLILVVVIPAIIGCKRSTPTAATSADGGQSIDPAEQKLRQSLDQRVREFHDGLMSEQESDRAKAVRSFLYTEEDLKKLFPDQEGLIVGLTIAREGWLEKPAITKQRDQMKSYGTFTGTSAENVRTSGSSKYGKLPSIVPASVPFYESSAVFDGQNNVGLGACFQVDGRWIWIPALDEMTGAARL